jgi:hypothetical protein
MTSIVLCMAAALLSFVAARRSLVAGLLTVLSIGYTYGITRANLPETFSHFIFDAAVIGLYSAQLLYLLGPARNPEFRSLKLWVGALVVWPMLLCLIPFQDPLIQLVGLRGNVFLLPFLLIGARLGGEELRRLALGIAILNMLAFLMAVTEFFVGVSPFFPENAVTQVVYASKDIANYTAYRIPSSFTSAHAYAGTMVMTVPLLLGAFVQKDHRFWKRCCMFVGLFVSILGVFLSGTRSHFVVLIVAVLVSAFSGHLKPGARVAWLAALVGIALIVSGQEKLQRFAELSDTDFVVQRFAGSVNRSLLDLAGNYPLGNGLGGGGTSIPYFLQHLVRESPRIENEYGRVLLELGLPGLCLWVGFIAWVFTRRVAYWQDPWTFGRRLAWFTAATYFATAFIGIGLLTSIPQTCLLLLTTGWIAAPLQKAAITRLAPKAEVQAENPLPAWQCG